MFDPYAAVRSCVTRGFHAIGEYSFGDAHVLLSPRLKAGDMEIATAYPASTQKDAQALLDRLCANADLIVLGAPLVSFSQARGGHILFSLTNEAYEALTRRINAHVAQAAQAADAESTVGGEPHFLLRPDLADSTVYYAYMRMRTLASSVGVEDDYASPFGFGNDDGIRRALWGCFGMVERRFSSADELYNLARYVAHMALNMFSGVATGELVNAYNKTKQVSTCIASCLEMALCAG